MSTNQAVRQMAAERRYAPRLRSLIRGTIVLYGGRSTYECWIRNQSKEGLMIEIADANAVPNQFELLVGLDKVRERCRVMWRTPGHLGVRLERADGNPVRASSDGGFPISVRTGAKVGPEKQSELSKRLASRFPHLVKIKR